MIIKPRPCKYCGSDKHFPFQCFQNPNKRKFKLPKMGKVSFAMKKCREVWFLENLPTDGGYICYLCGKFLWPIQVELDHVKSRSRYPELRYELTNLRPACSKCNTAKGSMDVEEYISERDKLSHEKELMRILPPT